MTSSTPKHDENADINDVMDEVVLESRVRGRVAELAQAMKCDSVGIVELVCIYQHV